MSVQTACDRDDFTKDVSRARSMLAGALGGQAGTAPERSPAGLSVWWHVRDREQLRLATGAQVQDRLILVDGELARFAVAAAGSQWTAAGSAGHLHIAIWGRDVDVTAIELAAVADPTRDLLHD